MKNVAFHLFGLTLAASCFFSLPIVGEEGPKSAPDPVQPILDRLAKMEYSAQQAWLRRLESRAVRAARMTLNPEQSDRQQARVHSLLHRKMITWQVLREAIRQTDSMERKAVERLADRYRNKVSDAFRRWPDESGRRLEAWEKTYRNWKTAGDKFERQDRLIDWLEGAIGAAERKASGPIPRKPKLEDQQPPAQSAPRKPAEAVKPQPPKPAPIAPEKPIEELSKPAAPRPAEKPSPPAEPKVPEKPDEKRRPERAAVNLPTESRVPPPSPVKPAAPTDSTGELPPDSVRVKVDELAVRIAGCNMAFRALEVELDEKGAWNAARLEPLMDRLKILVVRRGDLDLFREVVPEDKRASVAKLETSKSAVSQLGARIFEARRAASSAEFEGTEEERRTELGRLEMLSRQLAETAGEKKADGQ